MTHRERAKKLRRQLLDEGKARLLVALGKGATEEANREMADAEIADIERAISDAVTEEREACATLADEIIAEPVRRDGKPAKELRIRDAIRARGEV